MTLGGRAGILPNLLGRWKRVASISILCYSFNSGTLRVGYVFIENLVFGCITKNCGFKKPRLWCVKSVRLQLVWTITKPGHNRLCCAVIPQELRKFTLVESRASTDCECNGKFARRNKKLLILMRSSSLNFPYLYIAIKLHARLGGTLRLLSNLYFSPVVSI